MGDVVLATPGMQGPRAHVCSANWPASGSFRLDRRSHPDVVSAEKHDITAFDKPGGYKSPGVDDYRFSMDT